MTKITFPHLKLNTSYKVCNYFLKARIFAFLCGAICAAWGGSLTLVKGGKKEDTPANTHKPLTYKYNYKLQITNTISKRWKERGYTYKYTQPTFSHTNIIIYTII